MSEPIVESGDSAVNYSLPPPPPPPPTQRRPRVREVSSRFMLPLPPSSTTSYTYTLPSNKQRSCSVQKQHRQTEALSCTDDSRDFIRSPRQRKRSVMKLFKENCEPSTRSKRPDTPTVTTSSKLRLMQQCSTPTTSKAAKLLHNSGMTSADFNHSNLSSSFFGSVHDSTNIVECESNDLDSSSSTQSLADLRSSMPEASSRLLVDKNRNADSSKFSASSYSRSIDFPLSDTREYSLIHSLKTPANRKMGGLPLHPCTGKGRKAPSHQEDVHCLRLLSNRYLLWRYANAKAEASVRAQKTQSEKTLYSLGVKISELHLSVKQKRLQLVLLGRMKALSTILELQMPYLEKWSSLEDDYSVSLSEAIQAFLNISLRLPINGNVRADVSEVGEALNSVMKLMELIAFNIQSFMPKAEEMENFILELARVSRGERTSIEECGGLLFTQYKSQVEECSIRSQLIQLQHCSAR